MLLRLLLRAFLLSALISWLILSSGCSTTPAQVPIPRAKPTTCQLPVPDGLSVLTDEFKELADKRLQEYDELTERYVVMSQQDRDAAVQHILTLDKRLAQILLELKTADGKLYQTAVTELRDCQAWVKAQP